MSAQPNAGLTRRDLSRRDFLKVSVAGGVGLTVAVSLAGCDTQPAPTAGPLPSSTAVPTPLASPTAADTPSPTATPEPAAWEPNIYLTVDPAGMVTIRAFRSEMGQGIRTAIAMIVAEELDAAWEQVRIVQVGAAPAYGDQVTGGSVSVSSHYERLRQAGAMARDVLVSAAAHTWDVDKAACRTEGGEVIHPDGEQRLAYGALVDVAAGLPLPSPGDVQVKDPADFRVIGTPRGLYDAPDMVTGRPLYTSDLSLPGMVHAVVARCPVFEGQAAGVDDAAARAVPGVRDVVPISSGIAVVADSTWAALRGRAALDITWNEGRNADLSSEATRLLLADLAPQPGSAGAGSMDAVYEIPYLAHATMEPMVCLADVREGRCEVWAPSQAPQAAKQQAMSASRRDTGEVVVHVPVMGGGFGRRHVPDFVAEAVEVSRAVGAPVRLIWTREDDLQHDRYHPISCTYIKATLDASGPPSAMPRPQPFPMAVGVPTGYWRSVEQFDQAFARESFLDEIAAAGGLDPVELRLSLLTGRGRAVVELAAQKAGWGTALPEGWGRGIAYWPTFGATHVAQVVDLSVAGDGTLRARRVVCAVDCGTVINPDTVVAQMEGGIVFGLTAALKARITVDNGRVQQSNFHDYPLLTMAETPQIEVYLVDSTERPSGVGEMGVPPVAPAVANAVFAATGKRVRHIPILAADLA